MEWLRAHPYLDAFIGAGILILLGAFIVAGRSSVPGETAPLAWGRIGGHLLSPFSNVSGQGEDARSGNLYTQVQSGPPFTYTPASQTQIPVNASGDADFDFDAFIAMLSSSGSGPLPAGGQTNVDTSLDIYSFIPGGLISTSTPEKMRTPVQEELYQHGNLIGAEIQSFEDGHRNMPQVLKDQFEDPQDPGKIAALEELGNALAEVGYEIGAIENVPEGVRAANTALAKSYREMGAKLVLVPKARTDEERIAAMLAYNATVEAYTKDYVALATLFSAYGVTFASDEAGSVFTFSSGGF